MATIIVFLVLAALLALAARSIIKGKASCHGGCSSCHNGCSCKTDIAKAYHEGQKS